uniref:Uncharacterized protein n=1 Tax=Molossus molossus TaxID=27622 RepID=A0A7J8HIJ8_MOLMO|nr:hypothetical protein HJG59_010911 [Molossus molossus]
MWSLPPCLGGVTAAWGSGRGVGVSGGLECPQPACGPDIDSLLRERAATPWSPLAPALRCGRRPCRRGRVGEWRGWAAPGPGRGLEALRQNLPKLLSDSCAQAPRHRGRSSRSKASLVSLGFPAHGKRMSLSRVQWQSVQNSAHTCVTKRFRVEMSLSEPSVNRDLSAGGGRASLRMTRCLRDSEVSSVLGAATTEN